MQQKEAEPRWASAAAALERGQSEGEGGGLRLLCVQRRERGIERGQRRRRRRGRSRLVREGETLSLDPSLLMRYDHRERKEGDMTPINPNEIDDTSLCLDPFTSRTEGRERRSR